MFRRRRKLPIDAGLDRVLIRWNEDDPYTVRHLVAGGLHVFGASGSGKTSAMWVLADALLADRNTSLFVMAPKPGDRAAWISRCRRHGRGGDVMVIHPKEPHRLSFLGYETSRPGEGGGQTANVVRLLMELRGVIFREGDAGGGESLQWRKQDERLLTHGLNLLRLAGEEVTTERLHAFIMDLPNSPEQLGTQGWQDGYCNAICQRAYLRPPTTPADVHDGKLALDYVTREWCILSDRTRASILVGTMAVLSALNGGVAWTLFGRESTFTPDKAIEDRKVVIVDMPPDEWGDAGLVANVGLKALWQRAILRRQTDGSSPVAVIWGDESSLWVTSPSDAQFLSRCRSARGAMVYLCQSLSAYREVLPAEVGEAAVDALLANFSHKLVFALGDHPSATWASELCGKALRIFSGGGVQHPSPGEAMSLFGNPGQHSSNFHEQFEHRLMPGEFLHNLRTGGPANDRRVDAILLRTAQPFANGLPYVRVTFTQSD